MNHLELRIRPAVGFAEAPEATAAPALEIRIDGQDLLELVRRVELPFAQAEGCPHLAGAYAPLPAAVVLPELTGNEKEKVTLYGCECGIVECWPLRVRIVQAAGEVLWSDFEQPHRARANRWRYDVLGPFRFDAGHYAAELARAWEALHQEEAGAS